MKNRFKVALLAALGAMALSTSAFAGVTAGASSLFDTPDYSDTFTGTDDGGIAGRPYIAAGLPSYPIENSYGNPVTSYTMQPGAAFSIASDAGPGFVQGASPAYPTLLGVNANGAGSDTGFTQTGGNNLGYGVQYGLRDEYVVQVDAVQVPDRVDITSGDMPAAGHIFAGNSITVFFRGDGSGNASIFNGATDTPIQTHIPGFNTGIAAWNSAANGGQSRWYNYAVRYDQPDNEIEIYVDEVSKGVIDLNTFAGGIYSAGFSNQFVGVSTNTGDRTWTDNFQVGGNGALPAPPSLAGFSDDFERANGPVDGDSWTTHKGSWNIDSGRLVVGPTTEENMIFAEHPAGELPQEYILEFDWEYLSEGSNASIGKHAGVVFNWDVSADRFDAASSGYNLFWIDRATDFGLSLVRFDGTVLTNLAPPGGTFELFDLPPEHLRIEVTDERILVYADDVLVFNALDTTYRGGRAGLWTWQGDQVVAFDNVSITVPEPGTFALLALAGAGLVRRKRNHA